MTSLPCCLTHNNTQVAYIDSLSSIILKINLQLCYQKTDQVSFCFLPLFMFSMFFPVLEIDSCNCFFLKWGTGGGGETTSLFHSLLQPSIGSQNYSDKLLQQSILRVYQTADFGSSTSQSFCITHTLFLNIS